MPYPKRPGSNQRAALWAACVCIAIAAGLCVLAVLTHLQAGTARQSVIYARAAAVTVAPAATVWPQVGVDVNTADAAALCTLPGVGPSLAEAILAEREANGPWDYPEDLVMVKGIGEKTLRRIYPYLRFVAQPVPSVAP